MAIRTQQSISGFIASGPQLTPTAKGDPRFYARVGQEHFRREDDGTFTRLEATFHDMVAFRATAERDGQSLDAEEFVAKKIGHDLARPPYEVDRPRRAEPAVERQAPAREPVDRAAPEGVEERRPAPSAAPSLGMGGPGHDHDHDHER